MGYEPGKEKRLEEELKGMKEVENMEKADMIIQPDKTGKTKTTKKTGSLAVSEKAEQSGALPKSGISVGAEKVGKSEKEKPQYDWKSLTDQLTKLVRLKSTPVGMKFFEKRESLESIPKIRYTNKRFSVCMVVGQAVYHNWTAAVLPEYIHSDYCRAIHGMAERDERFCSGGMFAGIWHADEAVSKCHQNVVNCPDKRYEAIAVSPLHSGRIAEPDVCLLYMTPGQGFIFLSGLLYYQYENLESSFVGESTCSDSWIRTLKTGKAAVSIPCFAERKFGGVRDEEILITTVPQDLERAIKGMEALSRNGLRYPIAPYSITTDMMEGLPERYLEY